MPNSLSFGQDEVYFSQEPGWPSTMFMTGELLFSEATMHWHEIHGWRSVFDMACARLEHGGRLAAQEQPRKRHTNMVLATDSQATGTEPSTAVDSDEQLMEAYRDGDIRAFDRLFGRYRDMLYRYLVRQTGQPAQAEEIFQDVWASLIKHRARYQVKAKFRTYLFHIAHNKLIDYYRSNARQSIISYEETEFDIADHEEAMTQPDHHTDVTNKVARLMAQLEKLPAAQRDVFLLHEESGMSLAEIAEVMAVSRDTAKSRLRYALQRLRRAMERYR